MMTRFLLLIFGLLAALLFPTLESSALPFLDDPAKLKKLEEGNFSLANVALDMRASVKNNKELLSSALYVSLIEDIEGDLRRVKKADSNLSIGMRSSHRLFDEAWLRADNAYFELVGIVNRIDRAPFSAKKCGEIRFIYRLAYNIKSPHPIYSRLPMTLNAVYWAKRTENGCKFAEAKWQEFAKSFESGELKDLAMQSLPLDSMKSLEVNLQSVRWPSTIRPDMGGYAEYLLRAYRTENGKFYAAPLENTIDSDALISDKNKKSELLRWLKKETNLAALDRGVVNIPEKFLLHKVTSVALHGVHRMQNAPFSRVYTEDDFLDIDFSKYKSIKSSHGIIRRLNDLTCTGCHQGRTVAGFHFLGRDREETDTVNAIAVSASPHFFLDLERRERYSRALISGNAPNDFRPFSARAENGEGGIGSHCGLGDDSFAKWSCNSGLECVAVTRDDKVSRSGTCQSIKIQAGSSCQTGEIKHNNNPHRDKIIPDHARSCGEFGVCEASRVGFPGGMCSGTCSNLKAGEICGSIALLTGFNNCLAAGKKPFNKCLSENVRPASLQYCDEKTFCRDDYICARTASGKGGCIPPYFLFQLRVDGHHSPGLS